MFENLKKKLSEAVKIFAKKEEKQVEQQAVQHKEEHQIQAEKQTQTEQHQQAAYQEPKPAHTKEHEPDVQHVTVPAASQETQQHHASQQKQHTKQAEQHVIEPKVSLKTKIKGIFLSTVTLNQGEVDNFLDTLRESLLESNVAYETTDEFLNDLRVRLLAAKIDSKQIRQGVVSNVRQAMLDVLNKSKPSFNLIDLVEEMVDDGKVPVKILFLGPNGTGKTTTIAKLAYAFKNRGIRTVLSASDTFRAAAIEQTEHHANKVGVPVIKGRYGADPASIAFDAIAYAKAHSIDIVLIDSAGRQETNKNLISEMQKMVRVAQPELTIFIGESIAGNMITEQVKEFRKHIKIDGIVLTKLDVDPRGGNAISIAHTTGVPVLFFGVGESYDALQPYDPQAIVDAIAPAS